MPPSPIARTKPASGQCRRGNLGQTLFRLTRRSHDPMAAFDALPAPLRHWLAYADMPWSPASCLRLWCKLRAQGADTGQALRKMDEIQAHRLRGQRKNAAITSNLPAASGR